MHTPPLAAENQIAESELPEFNIIREGKKTIYATAYYKCNQFMCI